MVGQILLALLAALLQDLGKIEVVLGKTGTVILSLITLAFGILAAWQFQRSGVLKAALLEKDIHKEASQRKSAELEAANRLIGELQGKTDLQPLMTKVAELAGLAVEQMEMTRKFERDYANTQSSIATILQKMEESGAERYDNAVKAIQSCVTGISELRSEIAQDREMNNEAHQGLMRILQSFEERLPKGRHERTRSEQ